MATYKIIHPTTNKVVNLYSTSASGPIANGARLLFYNWENDNDQKWELESVGDYAIFRIARDRSKVMNRHSTNNNAHVWNYDGSSDTQQDSVVNTEITNGNMRIKLVHRNLYLTKNANDNYLSWAAKTESNRQYFKLEEVSGGGTVTGNILTYPCTTMRITQNYNGTTSHYNASHGFPADYPFDEGCIDTGKSYMYCPCDQMKVLRVYTSGTSSIWLGSTSPVVTPSGTKYIIMQVMHVEKNELAGIPVGKLYTRGQAMFL